ncbi:MAG: hypothetical protein IJG84_04685 [Kiritimatiellae bacterium]|nr:hypothetical protein [Kiritimatiellia bacterium]
MSELMEFLKRPYYFGLLTAAKVWGASHQASPVDYVVTRYPSLMYRRRSTQMSIGAIGTICRRNFLSRGKNQTDGNRSEALGAQLWLSA